MLKKFAVKNYRNFEERFELDLSNIREFKFNEDCIKNKLINKGLLYGKNGVGKSNLGRALIDVRTVMTGAQHKGSYNVINAWSDNPYAEFEYTFEIENIDLTFKYKKDEYNKLVSEELIIEDESLYSYNFELATGDFSKLQKYEELKHLNFEFFSHDLTIFRYLLTNAKLDKLFFLKKCMNFVEGMAFIKPSDISASFHGPSEILNKGIVASLIDEDLISDFQEFLKRCKIDLPLIVDMNATEKSALYINYKNPISFVEYASSGTKALLTLYRILKAENSITFLFIDEYDANLHHELAGSLLEYIKQEMSIQTLMTTHNTDLMSNKYMRPDCYLVLTNKKLTSIVDATSRELREGHNLEKLYQSGEFK